jgi:hypothetical protein
MMKDRMRFILLHVHIVAGQLKRLEQGVPNEERAESGSESKAEIGHPRELQKNVGA